MSTIALTAEQALTELRNNPQNYRTAEQLKALADRVSVYSSGSTTVLYGGTSGFVKADGSLMSTSEVVDTMNRQGLDTRNINRTELANFLNDDIYKNAVATAFGTDTKTVLTRGTPANDFLFNASTGEWARGSDRFALNTKGDVRILGSFAAQDRTLNLVEIGRAMADPDVSKINGIDKAIYQKVYDRAMAGSGGNVETARTALFESVKFSSTELMKDFRVAGTADALRVGTGDFLQGTGVSDAALPSNMQADSQRFGQRYVSGNEVAEWGRGASNLVLAAEELSGVRIANMGLKAMGTGGTLLAVAATTYTALEMKKALDAGDKETFKTLGKELTASWTGGLAGSLAAGSLAAKLASPFLAYGPPGAAAYLLAVGGSAIAGGYAGTEFVKELLNNTKLGLDAAFDPVVDSAFDNVWKTTRYANGVIVRDATQYAQDHAVEAGAVRVDGNMVQFSIELEIPDGNGGRSFKFIGQSGIVTTDGSRKVLSYERLDQTSADSRKFSLDKNGDGKIDQTSTTKYLSSSAVETQIDSNADGKIDTDTLNFGPVSYNLFDAAQNNNASYKMWQLNQNNGLSSNAYKSFTQQSSNFVVDYSLGGSGSSGLGLQPPPSWSDPIGAFYDSQSSAFDNAASIANKTTRAMNASGQGLSAAQLAALDTNSDGSLSTAEASGVRLWADVNEDGHLDSGELLGVSAVIKSADYGFYTRGSALTVSASADAPFAPTINVPTDRPQTLTANAPGNTVFAAPVAPGNPVYASLPVAIGFTAAALPAAPGYGGVPASNYRSLRDTDNVYYVGNSFIAFTASQVKINNSNRTYMIGTDGADSFDGSTYANTGFFNNSLLVNFLGGGGNDEMGGSTRNDNLWGGTGNDTEYGYAGDDKVYGEEGDDVLLGQDGNDLLDGGVGNDALVGGNGDDLAWGGDGADQLQGNDGADKLLGQNGNDVMFGQVGNDTLLSANDSRWKRVA